MNRYVALFLAAGLIGWTLIRISPGTAQANGPGSPTTGAAQLVAGAPGSGSLTGGASLSMNDAVAALMAAVGLVPAPPDAVASADLNFDGRLDLGDVVLLLRVVMGEIPLPQRAAPPATTPPQSFTLQTGWYDDHPVQFILSDVSDAADAAAMNVTFAPALGQVAGSDAVKPLYHFFTEQNGQRTPVPGQMPVFGSAPLEDDYTPLWNLQNVIVTPDYKPNTLTKDDDVTGDKGPSAGGFVVRIEPTTEILDCPILFDPSAGDGNDPYAIPQGQFSADAKTVRLPTEEVLYDGKSFLMIGPDTADQADSMMHHNNLAPGLAKAGMAAIPFYLILGPNGPSQPPVLSAAPDPIGPGNTKADYTPVWQLTTVQWTGAMAASPPVLQSDDDVKARLQSGDLKPMPGGFVFNCPIVALASAPTTTMGMPTTTTTGMPTTTTTGMATTTTTGMPTTGTPAPSAMTVAMKDFSFVPSDITVAVGTTVTWTNQGQSPHTSTSGPPGKPDGMWDSGTLNPGQSFSFTFTKAGTFPYYCTFHAAMGMVGSVTVR